RVEEAAEGAFLAVVRHWQPGFVRQQALNPVQCSAVHEGQGLRVRVADEIDAVNTEEASLARNLLAPLRQWNKQKECNGKTEAPPSSGEIQQRQPRQDINKCHR